MFPRDQGHQNVAAPVDVGLADLRRIERKKSLAGEFGDLVRR